MIEEPDDKFKSEIVSTDECRAVNLTTPLSFEKMRHYAFEIVDDMLPFFARDDAFKGLVEHVPNILIDYDKDRLAVNIWVSKLKRI